MSIIRRKKEIRLGNPAIAALGLLVLLSSCSVQRQQPCPAYVQDAYQPGEYDYSAPFECSRWYEHRYGWIWSSYEKDDALALWAEISNRPMYFEMDGNFRFSVKAADGFEYNFFGWRESQFLGDTVGTMLYNITTTRDKQYWNTIPL